MLIEVMVSVCSSCVKLDLRQCPLKREQHSLDRLSRVNWRILRSRKRSLSRWSSLTIFHLHKLKRLFNWNKRINNLSSSAVWFWISEDLGIKFWEYKAQINCLQNKSERHRQIFTRHRAGTIEKFPSKTLDKFVMNIDTEKAVKFYSAQISRQ